MDNTKPIKTSQLANLIDKHSPYFIEAKKRLRNTFIVFALATLVGFVFYENIIGFLVRGLSLEGINIVFTSPFQFINLAVSCGITTGLIVVFPFLVAQILFYLKPALSKKEYKLLTRFIPFSITLFVIGFAFGSLIMKWQIEIFLARSISLGIGNILDISGLLSTVFLTSALMGIGFQFPIVLLILMRVGLVTHKKLSSKRKWVYLGSFIFTLFLPPDSVIADVILTLPLIALFEFTLLMDRIIKSSR